MNFRETTDKKLKEFEPTLTHFTKKDWFYIILLSAFIVWGLYALIVQIIEGHGVTGMRDNVVWGLYIANFIFFIGISYAGAIISGILH